MNTTCEPWSIVLVPRPLPPFAAFVWYAISEILPSGSLVRQKRFFRWVGNNSRGEIHSPHGVVLNLNAERALLEKEILRWLKSPLAKFPHKETASIRNFVSYGKRWQGKLQQSWPTWERCFTDLSRIDNPETALEISNKFFAELVKRKIDPRTTSVNFPPMPPTLAPKFFPDLSDTRYIDIPILKKRETDQSRKVHRVAIDSTRRPLKESRVFQLSDRHDLLIVGGPPNSNKSGLTASLYKEMVNIVDSLSTRSGDGWRKFRLKLACASLDPADPVLHPILSGKIQTMEEVERQKRPWSWELAQEAVDGVETALATANLVLADLKGKIDERTEAISAHATWGGIICKKDLWETEMPRWRKYFRDIGVPVIFEMGSTDATSLITTYQTGAKILGRINHIQRVAKGWDAGVRTVAEVLLLDIMPNMAEPSAKNLALSEKIIDRAITVRF